MKLVIPGRLMGLNEYIRLCRGNKYLAANKKRQTEDLIMIHIKTQISGVKITEKVYIKFSWYEKNRKRDLDNIAFAHKFILDAFVKCGTIENDGWANIVGFEDNFFIDSKNPRVEIELLEAV